MNKTIQISLLVATLCATLQAAPAPTTKATTTTKKAAKKKPEPLTHAEFGYIETNGNTKTKTFNLDAKVKKKWDKQELKATFDGQYASDDGVETKNKYLIEFNYNYTFTKVLAFSYLVGYKADKFSGFSYQFYTGPGARYKVIKSKKTNLSFEGNMLYALDQYEDTNYDADGNVINYPNPDGIPVATTVPGEQKEYVSYRVKGLYSYKFTKTLTFSQELTMRGQLNDTPNYFVYSNSSLKSKISDIFSAGISYKVDYANRPPVDKKSTDTTLTLNLIMDY